MGDGFITVARFRDILKEIDEDISDEELDGIIADVSCAIYVVPHLVLDSKFNYVMITLLEIERNTINEHLAISTSFISQAKGFVNDDLIVPEK